MVTYVKAARIYVEAHKLRAFLENGDALSTELHVSKYGGTTNGEPDVQFVEVVWLSPERVLGGPGVSNISITDGSPSSGTGEKT